MTMWQTLNRMICKMLQDYKERSISHSLGRPRRPRNKLGPKGYIAFLKQTRRHRVYSMCKKGVVPQTRVTRAWGTEGKGKKGDQRSRQRANHDISSRSKTNNEPLEGLNGASQLLVYSRMHAYVMLLAPHLLQKSHSQKGNGGTLIRKGPWLGSPRHATQKRAWLLRQRAGMEPDPSHAVQMKRTRAWRPWQSWREAACGDGNGGRLVGKDQSNKSAFFLHSPPSKAAQPSLPDHSKPGP